MSVKLLYFAWVREKLGKSEERVELPPGTATIGALMDWLATRGPEYHDVFSRRTVIRAAIDQVHVPLNAEIAQAREIAFFPPVTGG